MLKIISNNSNYLAKVVKLGTPRKHNNADKLQCWNIDFQNVITDLTPQEGDIMIYFPIECTINKDFLSYINGFEDKLLNSDQEKKGFFNKHGRVRAISLRGEKSQGFLINIKIFEEWLFKGLAGLTVDINTEFDSWDDIIICTKYVPANQQQSNSTSSNNKKVPQISRLVPDQFKLHVDTNNLRKNVHVLNLDDIISIHYKKHGTSWVVGNILTKQPITWKDRVLSIVSKLIGKPYSQELKYDIIYSSRKVIKNEYETKNKEHYYKYDLWGEVRDKIGSIIPKGYILYGEAIGFTNNGAYIQDKYDYGCSPNEMKIYVYRITNVNSDGFTIELTDKQIEEFCNKYNLNYSDTFIYYGTVKELYSKLNIKYQLVLNPKFDDRDWRDEFIKLLELEYNNKNCYMCTNNVPEEGIILRKESLFEYEAYKLKSSLFLEFETKQLDKGVLDLESEQSI